MNIDTLGEIISYLDILDDADTLNQIKEIYKLTDNETDIIKEKWHRNTKFECKEDNDADIRGSSIQWSVNGKLHKDNDLPAVEYKDGSKTWYKNGKIHRDDDMHAVELANSDNFKSWWKDGKIHRDNDLPAVVCDGYRDWYKNDKQHRDNGLPAVEFTDGSKEWWIDGNRVK